MNRLEFLLAAALAVALIGLWPVKCSVNVNVKVPEVQP